MHSLSGMESDSFTRLRASHLSLVLLEPSRLCHSLLCSQVALAGLGGIQSVNLFVVVCASFALISSLLLFMFQPSAHWAYFNCYLSLFLLLQLPPEPSAGHNLRQKLFFTLYAMKRRRLSRRQICRRPVIGEMFAHHAVNLIEIRLTAHSNQESAIK